MKKSPPTHTHSWLRHWGSKLCVWLGWLTVVLAVDRHGGRPGGYATARLFRSLPGPHAGRIRVLRHREARSHLQNQKVVTTEQWADPVLRRQRERSHGVKVIGRYLL